MIPDQQPTDIVHESERVQQRTTAYAEGREDHVHDQRQEKSRPPSPVRIDSRDVIVSFRITSFTCQLEIKTPRYKHEKFMMNVEALPLAIHINNNRIGIKTLYVYYDPFHELSVVFWASDEVIPHIKEIIISPKEGLNREYYESKFKQILGLRTPTITLTDAVNKRGSGDPYAVIDLSTLMPKHNMDLSLILRRAIDEYLVDYTLSKKVLCPFCQRNIDFAKLKSAQNKWKLLDQIATHCDHCGSLFCSRKCFEGHRPVEKSIPEKPKRSSRYILS